MLLHTTTRPSPHFQLPPAPIDVRSSDDALRESAGASLPAHDHMALRLPLESLRLLAAIGAPAVDVLQLLRDRRPSSTVKKFKNKTWEYVYMSIFRQSYPNYLTTSN